MNGRDTNLGAVRTQVARCPVDLSDRSRNRPYLHGVFRARTADLGKFSINKSVATAVHACSNDAQVLTQLPFNSEYAY